MNFAAPELNFNSLWREQRGRGCERLSVGAQCGEETPGDTGGNGGNWGLGGHQPVIMVTSSDVSIWANVPHEPIPVIY